MSPATGRNSILSPILRPILRRNSILSPIFTTVTDFYALVGSERAAGIGGPKDPAPGIISITRHPVLWGATLWALTHLLANGDAASMIVVGGTLVLSLGGMAHIDRRREAALGAAWGPVKLTTSVVPFAASARGRSKLDWKGIGWWRPVAALALYAALMHVHEWIAGVPVLPD